MMIPEKAFVGLSVMTIAGMLQLLPVREILIFWQISEKNLWNIYEACSYADDDDLFLWYG